MQSAGIQTRQYMIIKYLLKAVSLITLVILSIFLLIKANESNTKIKAYQHRVVSISNLCLPEIERADLISDEFLYSLSVSTRASRINDLPC